MSQTLGRRHYDKGVLIDKRFTKAAKREMESEDIEAVSERIPRFKLERIYLVIQDPVNNMCKTKCGQVPKGESECKGHSDGTYSCKVRLISDYANFHFEHGWANSLIRDLVKLLAIEACICILREA